LLVGAALASVLAALVAPAVAAATTWSVPGSGSNVCTTVDPNCNTIAQAYTASTSGDTIQLGAGAHAVPSQINLTKALTITGAGIGVTFVQPTAAAFSVRTSGIAFQDFTIQNGTTGIAFQSAASTGTDVTRVRFEGQSARGIDVSLGAAFPVADVAVTDCQFAVATIAIRTSSTAQVSGLSLDGTSITGGTFGLYVANDNNTSRFSGLTIDESTFTNVANYAIYAEELRDAVIEDSTFTGGGSSIGLLKFYGSNGQAVSNVAIRRNVFSGFKGNALDLEIYLGGSTPGVGLENPITIEGNTITRDVAIATSSTAVFVRLPSLLTNAPVYIQDNHISASGTFTTATRAHAVQLRGNGPVVLSGNLLDGGNVGGTGTNPPSSGVFVQSQSASTTLPSGTFPNVMPADVSISATCNRITGFVNGVSVFDNLGNAYGGLQVGATVGFEDNAILGNSDGVVTAAAPPTIDAEGNYWGCPLGPTDAACDGVVGDVDADPFLTTIPTCVDCVADAECDDGLFCSGVETCSAGACVAGAGDPCTGGADCENLCNEAADDCLVPAGTECRAAVGDCDVAETCSGLGGACPSDGVASAGTTCRAAAGACDLEETCDGAGTTCPADLKSTAVCRAAGGVCDLAESCDGVGDACPADAKSVGVCRPIAGACDLPESCDGVGDGCPTDVKSTAVCRASAGVCDLAESCDGVGNACPADAKSTAVCRASAGVCDLAESCNGVSNTCPTDFKSTAVCRPAVDACDVAESCDGLHNVCPLDTGFPDGDGDTVCDSLDNCDAVANPGQENGDGDTRGDACDVCTNVVPTLPNRVKLTLTKIFPPASDDRLVFKGFFQNMPATPVVSPVVNGLRIAITDSTGATPIDVTIPGGSFDPTMRVGWRVNGSGTSWKYSNAGSPVPLVGGIYKAQLKTSRSTPGRYKFSVKGKNANYAVDPEHLPLTGTLVIDVPNAPTGQCGETDYQLAPAKPRCGTVAGGRTIKCG